MDLGGFGRIFMILGVVFFVLGVLLALGSRMTWFGRLPGDFVFGGSSWKIYLPIGTSLVQPLPGELARRLGALRLARSFM